MRIPLGYLAGRLKDMWTTARELYLSFHRPTLSWILYHWASLARISRATVATCTWPRSVSNRYLLFYCMWLRSCGCLLCSILDNIICWDSFILMYAKWVHFVKCICSHQMIIPHLLFIHPYLQQELLYCGHHWPWLPGQQWICWMISHF